MEYYFNEIDAFKFQRLINSILDIRYGENFRTTPLRGTDGGRDGETAPGNPFLEYSIDDDSSSQKGIFSIPRNGRYLFQVKHHRTTDTRPTDARRSVLSDFESELKNNVLTRPGDERVNFFFLITNVPASSDALTKLDVKRKKLLRNRKDLHADIWWKDQIVAFLDRMPSIWNSFPEIFSGGQVPFIANIIAKTNVGLSRSVRIALREQYRRDRIVKFRQIGLETELSKLFVDLDIDLSHLQPIDQQYFLFPELERFDDEITQGPIAATNEAIIAYRHHKMFDEPFVSALSLLLNEPKHIANTTESKPTINKYILEGGPGQGKSTITQMALQIYRQALLLENKLDSEGRWDEPKKIRLPFRVELRKFAEWLSTNPDSSVEQFLILELNKDSGSDQINVEQLHNIVERSPIFLVFDGLDEIGNDELREQVLIKIVDCVQRLEGEELQSDLRVIVTTRPPAIVGRRKHLADFVRLPIAELAPQRVENYLSRWLSVHLEDKDEQSRIREAFENRRREPHVQALIRTPMQLSVLLHFIKLKDEAFPDHRAKLYKEYFQIVIDRDVAKSPELRNDRDLIEGLHQFLGYKLHALTETQEADGTLPRTKVLDLVGGWLVSRGDESRRAEELFKLGEDRLGLIVTAKGEGKEGRYGYEIQPVREYFAAAYIDNQVQGDANDIFEAMVRHPYWKEVALFLAGLRRPNEKADLVIRACYLDSVDSLGWRQDGRSLVLQLLQEGVLSEPKHVFLMALDKVFELLNPHLTKVQKEPDNLLESISKLICMLDGRNREQFSEKLLELIDEYKSEQDEYVIFRIYRVASLVLNEEDCRKVLLNHDTTDPSLIVKLRLFWPYRWGVSMEKATGTSSYWSGAPEGYWAYWWWGIVLLSDLDVKISAPKNLHRSLILEFATNPIFPQNARFLRGQEIYQTASDWAVWKLLSYHQNLQGLSNIVQLEAQNYENWLREELTIQIDYSGLEHGLSQLVRALIEIYQDILISIVINKKDLSEIFSKHFHLLQKNLNRQGLLGWLTFRCSTNILSAFLRLNAEKGRRMSYRSALEDTASNIPHWKELYLSTQNYRSISKHEDALEEEVAGLLHRSRFSHRWSSDLPTFIRLEDDGELIPIVDILAHSICGDSQLALPFLKEVTFTTEIIRPLVDRCKNCLPKLLVWLNKSNFARIGIGNPLTIQRVNQILKIARESDQPDQIGGAFVALSTSRFIKSAGVELLLKLCRYDSHNLAASGILFQTRETPLFSESEEIDPKEVKIIEDVASQIIKNPELYQYRLVCVATKYLVENSPLNLSPLAQQEEELKITIEMKNL